MIPPKGRASARGGIADRPFVDRSPRRISGWFPVTQRTKGPICHSRVAMGVHAAGVGLISIYTARTSKLKLSDWSIWEQGDIPGGRTEGRRAARLGLGRRHLPRQHEWEIGSHVT